MLLTPFQVSKKCDKNTYSKISTILFMLHATDLICDKPKQHDSFQLYIFNASEKMKAKTLLHDYNSLPTVIVILDLLEASDMI